MMDLRTRLSHERQQLENAGRERLEADYIGDIGRSGWKL